MAQENNEQTSGFVTQAQKGGSAATPTTSTAATEEDRKLEEKINEALLKFDMYMKGYVADFIKQYMGETGFVDRKITDTPTDALMIVNRKFVTENGITRPASPVTGQRFYQTSNTRPVYWSGSDWRDAVGSVV